MVTAAHVAHGDLRGRIVASALRCIARWGVAKTSLDDIAREAGCSRASVYRAFPGGKDSLLQEVVQTEVVGFFSAVDSRLAAATTLEEMLTDGVVEALAQLRDHEALGFLARFEPDRILLAPSSDGLGRVLPPAVAFTSGHLRRFVPGSCADEAAEWVVRVVLSYAMCPPVTTEEPADGAHLVRVMLIPAISALVASREPAGASGP